MLNYNTYQYTLDPLAPVEKIHIHTITGKMVQVDHMINTYDLMKFNISNNDIKRKLVQQLAEEMLSQNIIDFALQDDLTQNKRKYMARIFVAPRDQTQILKTVIK